MSDRKFDEKKYQDITKYCNYPGSRCSTSFNELSDFIDSAITEAVAEKDRKLAELEAKLKETEELLNLHRTNHEVVEEENQGLREKLAASEAEVGKYGDHKWDCIITRRPTSLCNCGWSGRSPSHYTTLNAYVLKEIEAFAERVKHFADGNLANGAYQEGWDDCADRVSDEIDKELVRRKGKEAG